MNTETKNKDFYFAELGRIADDMVVAHGKDFAMGALVLAARFIAERDQPARETGKVIPAHDPAHMAWSRNA